MFYDTVISIEGKSYALFRKGPLANHPYMIDLSTGGIPYRLQRPLLKEFLRHNGVNIEPWEEKTTHWCILQAIKVSQDGAAIRPMPLIASSKSTAIQQKTKPNISSGFPLLTADNIEQVHLQVRQDTSYGTNMELIHSALRKFPNNTDGELIAMKISLIDLTNSTHIGMHQKRISLQELVKVIQGIPDFDARISQGDPSLVSQLAKTNGRVNFFSFASKYCTYHNVAIYRRDDYSIFDNVVEASLPHYVSGLTQTAVRNWKNTYNYAAFNDCIGELLERADIQIPFRRRKFDHFLWYTNR